MSLHFYSESLDVFPLIYVVIYRDNKNTDILGANLFDKYLSQKSEGKRSKFDITEMMGSSRKDLPCAKACISILVETGVHKRDSEFFVEHCQRDFLPLNPCLCKPAFVVDDVSCAVDTIFREENYQRANNNA